MSARSLLLLVLTLGAALSATSCVDSTIQAVNSTPEATITSPVTGDQRPLGATIMVRGAGFDPNNSAAELSATWLLDDDIVCPASTVQADGTTVCELSFLEAGTFRVLLEVRDPRNATGSAFVDIVILEGAAPVVTLILPVDEAVYIADEPVPFEAQVSDSDGEVSDLSLTWSSSAGDDLSDLPSSAGADGSAQSQMLLSAGDHTITLTATDAFSLVGTASVQIEVVADPDSDGDGFPESEDGDDNDPTIYPGAPDLYGDGIDQNCDGVDGTDTDGDGYPAPGPGVTADIEDCNDNDGSVHPNAGDTIADGVDQDCDGLDCDAVQDANAYFVVCPDAMEWALANATCLSHGYDALASVLSAGELAVVAGLSTAVTSGGGIGGGSMWIGLNDRTTEGSFVWEDGSLVSFLSWNTSEPNQSGDEDCTEFIGNNHANAMFWNDTQCDQSRWWACSRR